MSEVKITEKSFSVPGSQNIGQINPQQGEKKEDGPASKKGGAL